MKFILSSVLCVLLASVVGATRELASTVDDYAIDSLTATASGLVVTLTATHGAGDGTPVPDLDVHYYATCPHGATDASSTIDSSAWLTAGVPAATANPLEVQWGVTIDPSITSDSAVFASNQAKFCVWLGLGDSAKENAYGFRELEITVTFNMNGAFSIASITTQAYIPGTATAEKSYTATATQCSPASPTYPGVPICVRVCPNPNDGNVAVTSIDTMTIANAALSLSHNAFAASSITSQAQGTGATVDCRVIYTLLSHDFYPTKDPTTTAFTVSGGSTLTGGRRFLQQTRTLQTQQDAPIEDVIVMNMQPTDPDNSGAMSSTATIAAGAVLGAAALMI